MNTYSNSISLLIYFILVGLFSFPSPVSAENSPKTPAFKIGEKLTYQLRWGIISAGEATLEVLPEKTVNGVKCCHFRLTVKTNTFVDTFYKVRDVVDSFTDMGLTYSVLYKQKQQEGSTKRDIIVDFDLKNLEARYSNNGISNDPIAILQGTIDPLASLYYIRNNSLSKGKDITRPITDGQRNVIGNAKVIKRQSVTIRGKKYKAYLVEPDLKDVRGVFEKSDKSKIKLWFTDDDRHLLVKIKSKVAVGSFYGVLTAAENVK
jgi:hypothetical protein